MYNTSSIFKYEIYTPEEVYMRVVDWWKDKQVGTTWRISVPQYVQAIGAVALKRGGVHSSAGYRPLYQHFASSF